MSSCPHQKQRRSRKAATIPLIRGVDLVASPGLLAEKETVKAKIKEHGLQVISIAADTFTQAKWKQGSLSCSDPEVRKQALEHTEDVIAFCKEVGYCSLMYLHFRSTSHICSAASAI